MWKLSIAAFCGVGLGLLVGCAKSPDQIAGVPHNQACTAADRQRLATLYGKQEEAVAGDAIGVFLIGVPVASLAGADSEAEIAILKGRCGAPKPRPKSEG